MKNILKTISIVLLTIALLLEYRKLLHHQNFLRRKKMVIDSDIIKEKIKIQKELNEKSDNDLNKYFEHLHDKVMKLVKENKIKIKITKCDHY